ncbi:MAG TPA: CHAP domain-containing protein [Baekduia sp.]|uniref:CHAP domain-containing protein n=1 Tax=Baekduia sp. TaxID=2600305 RepID=UPI002D789727|nr:CHAP domain-containing protein [Baekduia sp.]HET6508893.1 CHAP domain-containing protein [Baekduia sp.]
MSVENVMARIAELHQGLVPPSTLAPTTTGGTQFASLLSDQTASATATLDPSATAATATTAATGATAATGTAQTAGQRALAFAEQEVGQAEQPPGSNDSPRIAEYRTATAGSGIGPWCAYFVSWAAKQAGAPLGEAGQGFGSVSAVASWAQRTGRWNPAASGQPPQAGDLIVWGGQHIGIVESVDADGKIHTVEGNSSNMVTRRTHDASGDGATGYVRLG